MKKLLIAILVIILMVMVYFLMFKNISIADWTSKNFNDIKDMSEHLNQRIEAAKEINNQKYPQNIETLETSIKNLKIAKEKYEAKTSSIGENAELGVVEVKQYKIERLWITLQNYAKERNVELVLDLVESSTSAINNYRADLYDLNITLVGDYIGITDFVFDIENDDTLDFKIQNFTLVPETSILTQNKVNTSNTGSSTQTTVTYTQGVGLKATFTIKGVGIELN